MKKFGSILISCVLCLVLVIGLTACGKKSNVKVLAFELTAEEYAFAVAKGNDTLKQEVNDLLAEMKEDGSLETLINSYFDGTATFTYTNPASSDGCFVVATNAYFPPFEYMEGEKFVGVDIEIASLIAQKLGKTLFIKNIDFTAVITDVQQGNSDIAMAGITVNAEREELINFTTPYYESAQVLVVREDDTTFDGCETAEQAEEILKAQSSSYVIGTQAGTTGYMYSAGDADFGYDGFKNLTTKPFNSGALAITDLANGKINAVIIDKQPAIMISKSVNG